MYARQLSFIGHILRHDSHEKTLLLVMVVGKRVRGFSFTGYDPTDRRGTSNKVRYDATLPSQITKGSNRKQPSFPAYSNALEQGSQTRFIRGSLEAASWWDGPHQVFRKKGSDKNTPMFSNIFISILRRGPTIIILRAAVDPRAASLRHLL